LRESEELGYISPREIKLDSKRDTSAIGMDKGDI